MRQRKFKDLTGRRFGRWTVLGLSTRKAGGKGRDKYWHCRCDCGTERDVIGCGLKDGTSKSCGCYQRDKMMAQAPITKHGLHGTRIYRIYHHMINRCEYAKDVRYPNYGGRGISVCDEWRDRFDAFVEWAHSTGYSDELSIDRIDNDGNYTPENCRWSTPSEQAVNRRSTTLYTINGVTKCLNDWCKESALTRSGVQYRLKNGWTIESALFTPNLKCAPKGGANDSTN